MIAGPQTDDEREDDRRALADERESLRAQLFDWLDPVMTVLGLATAVLLLVEFAADLSPRQAAWVSRAQQVIWAAFAVEFAVQFVLAPRKLHFLRGHWLAAIAVALPALRVFRALRAARALRSLRLVRLLGGTNRAMKALRAMLRGQQFGYLVALTLLAVAAGTVGIAYFERGQPDAVIRSFGDALWWAACMVTTINNEKYVVSPEGRILGVLLRLYAVSIFGLVTANIASYFVGQRQAQASEDSATAAELRRLRAEVQRLTEALAVQQRPPGAGGPSRWRAANGRE